MGTRPGGPVPIYIALLALAACGDPTSPDLGSLAGYWEGTGTYTADDGGIDSVTVELVILPPGDGSSLFGCASFRFPWMGADSRLTINIVGSAEENVVSLSEAPTASEWTFDGQRTHPDMMSGTTDHEQHRAVDVTLARTSTGGTCETRALPQGAAGTTRLRNLGGSLGGPLSSHLRYVSWWKGRLCGSGPTKGSVGTRRSVSPPPASWPRS